MKSSLLKFIFLFILLINLSSFYAQNLPEDNTPTENEEENDDDLEPINEDEFYDGGEQEFDFNELNRNQTIPFTSTANNYVDTTDIQPTNTYEKLKHQYDESKPPATVLSVQADTEATELGDENPIVKFNKLKEEIDTIEKDIEFYSTHKELFKAFANNR